ncbi:Alpha/Beta hydrolase protein [Cunninghamella echinulata]|nr:Alpha/Beta hydrolase protein [Cunninghamella echinulata]
MTDIATYYFNPSFENFGALDLYSTPTANETTPLIVYIHGGAWRSEDKNDHNQLAMNLASQGFTVAVTNYRLSLRDKPNEPPKVQHPCHIQDTYEALTYLHQYRPKPVYDQNKIFLLGHSAGAHIATMLLLEPTQYSIPYVKGIIGADGIYDLPLLLKTFPTYMDFISQAFGDDTSNYLSASPISKSSSSLVPVLILQSLEDQLIDIGQAESILNHLKKLNINAILDTTLKGDHYDMIKTKEFTLAVSQFVSTIVSQ